MGDGLKVVRELLALNGDLVRNCLAGLTDEEAQRRVVPEGNSIAFLLAHLADARHFLLKLIEKGVENPLEERLGEASSIDQVESMPSLDELRAAWERVTEHLTVALETVPTEVLAKRPEQPFPVDDPTTLGALAFLAQHESYHLGQLALLRRALGHPGMSYERG